MLRELIPHSDQKRDKASFLLEVHTLDINNTPCYIFMRNFSIMVDRNHLQVIDYIHFLQEKVHKYEGSYQGWNHEPEKLMPWVNTKLPPLNLSRIEGN